MSKMTFDNNRDRRSKFATLALCTAPLALLGCSTSTGEPTETSGVSVSTEAVTTAPATPTACGYALSAEVKKVNKKGFKAKIKIKNAAGGKLNSTGFTVHVNAGAAELVKVGHGTFQAVDGGYLLSTVSRDETDEDCEVDDETPDPEVLAGKAYRFHLKFEGTYSQLVANIISSSGVNCDQTAPSVQLTTSGDFFTSPGTLTLAATASDNAKLAKVVFAQDGVTIGTDTTAPYSLAVPVTSTINGRHRYTATAYDLTGNQGAETKRVLVAIGNKFFGTATTVAADYTSLLAHFNQITPGNAGKWGSVEATRDVMNWTDLDTAYQFAKQNHLPFKLHTLVWGAQQPAWISGLSTEEQLAELEEWFSALAERYPDAALVDVVNEPLHQPPPYAAALGGAGVTGWDWVVTAFEKARSHFPNAELLLNDYSILTMASSTQDYLKIVKILKDRGLIDGIGEQGHFYERTPDLATITTNLNALQATGLPLYITELDLNLGDDAQQANRMRDLFTAFWSNPSVLGITHWGYLQNNVWQPNIYLIRSDGSVRPALTWIECFRAGGTNCAVPAYVPAPHTGTASGITLQAEEFDSYSNLLTAGNVVAYAGDGSWFGFSKVVYQNPWNALKVTYANGGGGTPTLTFHLDSLDSAPVATVALAPTADWGTSTTVSVPWTALEGQKDLFVKFNGGGANVDKLEFVAPPPPTHNILPNGTFETGTSGWYTYGGGVMSATNTRAHGGAQSLVVTNRASGSPAVTDITSLVTAGKSYPLTLWASISSPDGTGQAINVTQGTTCKNADGTNAPTQYAWIVNPITIPADGSWVKFSGTITVPNCTLASVQFWAEGGAGSDLYLDDVEVTDVGAPPSNLITDGTFETGKGGWFGWGQTSLDVTTTSFHAGAQSLLGAAMTPGAAIAHDIRGLVQPGKKYTATAWVSVANRTDAPGLVKWQTVQNCNAAGDSYPWLNGVNVANGQWVQITGTIDLSACTTVDNLLLFAGADTGDLYVDDVTLTLLP